MKKVIVTWWTKWIWYACASLFSQHWYDVVMTYSHDETHAESIAIQMRKTSSGSIFPIKSDTNIKSDLDALFDEHSDATTLINNIGSVSCEESFDWKDMFTYHLMWTVHATELFVKNIDTVWSIVNISSILWQDPFSWYKGMRLEAYCCMKSAVDMYTKICSKKYHWKIRVNAVSPWNTETPSRKWADENLIEERKDNSCIWRFVTPDEIGQAVFAVATNEAINWQILQVDWWAVARGYEA